MDPNRETPRGETAFVIGAALHALAREDEAEVALRDALHRNPAHRLAATALAHLLRSQGRYHAAATTVEALLAAAPGDRDFALQAIGFLRDTQQPVEAERIWISTQQASSPNPEAHYLGGEVAMMLGDFAEAIARFDQCLALDPVNPGAIHARAIAAPLAHNDAFAAHLERLALDRARLPIDTRIMLDFAQGKLAMDGDDIATAFLHFDRANSSRHAQMPWDRAQLLSPVRKPGAITSNAQRGEEVVFIIGMPRSGTTLLASRLGQHPDVAERGELPWLGMLDASAIDADVYLRHLHQDDAPRSRYLDKNPLNFRHLDRIAQEFPRARVLHCRRDPRDTAVSCYTQYFAHPDMAWSSSWGDIVDFQRRYRDLIEARPADIAWLDIDYADLVAVPEATLRRATGFLGLDWDDRVLATPARGSIGTASVWQARQPMHTRSLGRWRSSVDHIKPLLDVYGNGPEPLGWTLRSD